MTKLFWASLFVLGASALTYFRFQLLDLGSTSNPIYLLAVIFIISLLNLRISRLSSEIFSRAFIYIPISAIGCSFFLQKNLTNSFDHRFLLTSTCFLVFSAFFSGYGVLIARSCLSGSKSFFVDCMFIVRSLSILLCFAIFINLVGLHCILFKCRELSSRLGFSLINSEPAYIGILLFFLITTSLFFRNSNSCKHWPFLKSPCNILILLSLVAIGFSKSPLIVAMFLLYALSILFVLFVFPLFIRYKFTNFLRRVSLPQILFGLMLFIGLISTLLFTKIGPEFYSLVDPSSYSFTSGKQFDNPFQTLVLLGGNRFSYLFSIFYIDPSQLMIGHSIYSSSLIFQSYVQQFFDNIMNVGFFVELGAKPNSSFIQLLFTFGLFGSLFIYYPLFKLFFSNLLSVFQNSFNFTSLWISFSPLFILLYPCPNTDPWKFLTLSIFVAFATIENSLSSKSFVSADR